MGQRNKCYPLRLPGEGHLVSSQHFYPSPHSRFSSAVTCAAHWGVRMEVEILDVETSCQHPPNLSGRWGVPYPSE